MIRRERDEHKSPTLGLFRPAKIEKLLIEPDASDWTPIFLSKWPLQFGSLQRNQSISAAFAHGQATATANATIVRAATGPSLPANASLHRALTTGAHFDSRATHEDDTSGALLGSGTLVLSPWCVTGSCSTVACWHSSRNVRRTIVPSGNSNAS
jgi:hypothetical protein